MNRLASIPCRTDIAPPRRQHYEKPPPVINEEKLE